MSDKILTIKRSTLVDIANEVRAKTGSSDLIKVSDLDDAVADLSGGIDPMSLGNANNPEFGFYYGQVFSMDDPITIDAKILIEEMQKLDTSEFYFNSDIFNIMIPVYNPNSNYISVKQLYATVYVNQETEEISIEIGNTDDYSILNKTYTIPYTGKLTITLRQLYKDAYTQNDEPMSAESVDALISTFPLRYGYVCAGYNSYSCESGQSNWWSTGDFNNPENAIYKCLKIGK